MHTFTYLSEQDMVDAGVRDMPKCMETMEEVLRLTGIGDYRMAGLNATSHGAEVSFPDETPHPRMPTNAPDRRFMAMPAYLGGRFHIAGAKWYGSNVQNRVAGLPRSILMLTLNDPDTGLPLAHMSANLLSAYRTGAIPGIGARRLSDPNAEVIGLVAQGAITRTSLEAFMVARPNIKQIRVTGRRNAGQFHDWATSKWPDVEVITVRSTQAALDGADIVSIAPNILAGSGNYIELKKEWLKPNAFVSLPADIQMDDELLYTARHVADVRALYEAWELEYPRPAHEHLGAGAVQVLDKIHEGKMEPNSLECYASDPSQTHDPSTQTIFSVGGMATEDVAWGLEVLKTAKTLGLGTELKLWDTPALL